MKVKTERENLKEYLKELAELKAKESFKILNEIKARLKEPLSSLSSYVTYVTELDNCK
jgi:hypothetical protein